MPPLLLLVLLLLLLLLRLATGGSCASSAGEAVLDLRLRPLLAALVLVLAPLLPPGAAPPGSASLLPLLLAGALAPASGAGLAAELAVLRGRPRRFLGGGSGLQHTTAKACAGWGRAPQGGSAWLAGSGNSRGCKALPVRTSIC
jgi:hypothetical protein